MMHGLTNLKTNYLVVPVGKIYPTSYSRLPVKITLIDTIIETLLKII
jgi:hypothetical protein